MATCTRFVLKALSGCHRQLLPAGCPAHTTSSLWNHPARTFAAAKAKPVKKPFKTRKQREAEAAEEEEEKKLEKKKAKAALDAAEDKYSLKPRGLAAWVPVDDVYVVKFYPRTVHPPAHALSLLRTYQELDLTPPDQPVFIELKLDMKLEKKKKLDPFVGTVQLPHRFKTEANKVLVFTENPAQVQEALDSGAAFAGGSELITKILDDKLEADFYVTVPDMLTKLTPLKNKLRRKFPKNKRGSVGMSVPRMVSMFLTGHEYLVEKDCFISTCVGTLDMPEEHLLANMQAIVVDVCTHRPESLGVFIERAILSSQTSESVLFRSEDLLPKPPAETEEKDQ